MVKFSLHVNCLVSISFVQTNQPFLFISFAARFATLWTYLRLMWPFQVVFTNSFIAEIVFLYSILQLLGPQTFIDVIFICLRLPVLFGHLETFSKWSKSLKTCLIRTTNALDSYVLVCVSAWYVCISPLTNYNVCRRNIKQTHTSLCFTINFYWLEDRWDTKRSFTLFFQSYNFYRRHLNKLTS